MFSAALRKLPPVLESLLSPHHRLILPVAVSLDKVGGEVRLSGGGYHQQNARSLSVSSALSMPYERKKGPVTWPKHNLTVFDPQSPEEKRRPAYVCHMKTNIKYSPWKMWYITCLIRGVSIDEALRQLDYVHKKGSYFVKQTLLEAQELAVQQHHVEFRSNLWVAESFVTKGVVVKGIRRHAKKRIGMVEYFHCHYFVRLEEGPPPKDYFLPPPDGPTLLQRWIQDRRDQRVFNSM